MLVYRRAWYSSLLPVLWPHPCEYSMFVSRQWWLRDRWNSVGWSYRPCGTKRMPMFHRNSWKPTDPCFFIGKDLFGKVFYFESTKIAKIITRVYQVKYNKYARYYQVHQVYQVYQRSTVVAVYHWHFSTLRQWHQPVPVAPASAARPRATPRRHGQQHQRHRRRKWDFMPRSMATWKWNIKGSAMMTTFIQVTKYTAKKSCQIYFTVNKEDSLPGCQRSFFGGKMTTCFHTQTRYHGTGIFTYSVTIYFSHSWIWGNIRSEHFSGFPDSLLMGILGPEATNQDFMAWLLGASPQLGYVVCGPWSISPLRIGMFPFQMAELHGL